METLTSSNAFRILALDPRTPLPKVLERANELRAYLGIDQVPTYPSDYPTFVPPERTLETVAAAVQRLEDPLIRLRDEATWFHLHDQVDSSAVAALVDGNLPQAKSIWEAAVNEATDVAMRLHYQHNFAVLYLCEAEISSEQNIPYPREQWDRTVAAWTPLLKSHAFWQWLVTQSPAVRDPRCRVGGQHELRAAVGHTLASRSSFRSREALAEERPEEAREWLVTLSKNRFPAEFATQAVDEVLKAMAELIRFQLEPIQASLRKAGDGSLEVRWLESRIHFARKIFEQFRSISSETAPNLQDAADVLAETYQLLGLYQTNVMKDCTKALGTIETAYNLAASEGLRVRLQQDARILRWNTASSAFEAAVKADDYAGAERAFKELEQNRGPDQDSEVLDAFRGALRSLRITQGLKSIKKAPSLRTINGFGTTLYGRSNVDPESGTYLTTLFFAVFFIPLICLRRYRVESLEGGGYRFYGKAPLTNGQRLWNTILIAAASAGLIALGAQESTQSQAPYSAPPDRPLEVPRTTMQSGDESALRAEIVRRRPLLVVEQAALDAERQAIDGENAALDILRADIETNRDRYPGGLPPDEYDRDQRAAAEYNRRLKALHARIDAHNARLEEAKQAIAEFNGLVNRYNASR